ncbi:MAG: TldD/PmbA family protein [Candidatus Aminicenantes bacterium]|nr:TldD/PmbA family protein [Candidatus Aminicenantes bacterium]
MSKIERREFLKLAGTGVGAVVTTGLFPGRLIPAGPQAASAGAFTDRFGVTREDMAKVLGTALSKGGEFADLFFEHKVAMNVVMENDIIRQSSENVIRGVGIRVIKGRQTGFGYTSVFTPESMKQAALTAAAIASSGGAAKLHALREVKPDKQVYMLDKPFADAPLDERIALVKEAYAAALAYDKRIVKAVINFVDEIQYVTIANSEGLLISDARPQVRLYATATAQEGKVRNTGNGSAGGRVDVSFFRVPGKTPKDVGERAGWEAVTLLDAVDPKAGDQPVVLGSRQSGVMIHEAVGHPFEAEGVWQKTSIFWDRMGQMIASPCVTIYEDPTIPHLRGSMNIDDEGTSTRKVMMIEKGRLVGFLHDKLSSRILGVEPNGHGRRESYRVVPICRMNNTMLERGEASPEDVIKSVKRGFYADTYQGGMVEDTGKFTFSVNLGFLIEDGKLTRPVKNATLIGTNVQVLKNIELIANDMDYFLGTCGKEGQSAPVTAGTPTFKLSQMTVGGRA